MAGRVSYIPGAPAQLRAVDHAVRELITCFPRYYARKDSVCGRYDNTPQHRITPEQTLLLAIIERTKFDLNMLPPTKPAPDDQTGIYRWRVKHKAWLGNFFAAWHWATDKSTTPWSLAWMAGHLNVNPDTLRRWILEE